MVVLCMVRTSPSPSPSSSPPTISAYTKSNYRRINAVEEQVIEHLASTCGSILLLTKGEHTGKTKFVHFFRVVQDATVRKCRERRMEAMQSLDQIPLGSSDIDWMGGFFDEVFLNNNTIFDLDFNVEAYVPQDLL